MHDGPQRVYEDDHDHSDCGMRRRPSGDIDVAADAIIIIIGTCVRWCQQA
jgi:hypothetical protein